MLIITCNRIINVYDETYKDKDYDAVVVDTVPGDGIFQHTPLGVYRKIVY